MTSFYLSIRRNLTVLLVLVSLVAAAQERIVSGKVSSAEDGTPVPGVNIIEKGTSNGTTTDVDGNFKINVTSESSVLSISFIGYKTQEIMVGNQTNMTVSLAGDITTLSEIVVTGYGQQEKRDVTGVVVDVKAANFNKGAIVSPDQLIAGKIAGVQITPNSGEPGTGGTVRIRGGTSIGASNDPLYVVDGVPLDISGIPGARNPLNFINPNDIETFTVLKDASAGAIYGSRAANGVIIITTKKGRPGVTKVTYDGFYSTSEIAKRLNVLDGPQYRELVALFNPSKTALLYDNDATILNKTNTDWQKQIMQTAVGQSHNISLSGGKENTSIRASLGYLEQDGIIKTSSTKRTSFALNLNQKALNEKLTMEFNMKGSETRDKFNGGGIGGAYSMAPTQPVYDTAKLPLYGGFWEWSTIQLGTKNPVANNSMTVNQGTTYRGLGNARFDYSLEDVIPGLRAHLNLGVDITSAQRNFFQPTNLRLQAVESFPGSAQAENTLRLNRLLETYVNYTKNLGSINSKIDVTAGYSWQNFSTMRNGYTGSGLNDNSYGFNNPSVAVGKREIYADNIENRLVSFFGRVNYSLKNRYLLTVNLRNDGSTRFGGKNRWGFFPSAAIGWRVYDENFFSGLKNVFSDLKLRVGFGVNGNQEIPNYGYLPVFQPTNGFAEYAFGSSIVSPIRPNAVDPNLKWEQTESLNVGLDFGVLKGRLSGSIEYYNKDTKDLLFVVNVPAGTVTGDRILTNIGKVNNNGLELTLNGIIIDKTDFRWDIGFNMAANYNKVVALDGVDDPKFQGYTTGGISGGLSNTVQILKVGFPVNTFRLYEHKRGADGKPLVDGVDWNNDGVVDDRDMYKDINGDGILNDQDRQPNALTFPQPKVFMGLTSNVTFKNLDLSFTLRANLGGQVYNNVISSTGYLNRINELAPQNLPVAALQTNFSSPQYLSNHYLEDATFLRMDNITLGYTVNKFGGSKIRVYGTIQNAFVLTKYTGLDPEVVNGIDNNLYPRSRTFVFGLSIGL
ncbi:MAG: TonB-dependent receptor [Cytophagales bacterium]|nr:TonB-dependent receptor [Cytophagales bacterium]